MDGVIDDLARWYASECNGDWEHSFGIKIETLDNPGWNVEIDLEETFLAGRGGYVRHEYVEETNWVDIKIEDHKFSGAGDPSKLQFILGEFSSFKKSAEADQKP